VKHALIMVEHGADLIDIGAESSRPGSDPIDEREELRRLIPVVREICRRVSSPVSVDTRKARVAEQALDAGASIINDISALRFDREMGRIIAQSGAALILMHMQGTPKDMQRTPHYRNVVEEVRDFFTGRMQAAGEVGIGPERIVLDPGIGFGKNLDHNLTLLAQLDALTALGRPLLVGVSRKAFIGRVLDRRVGERLMGTAAAVAAAVFGGARVVRVHDVSHMRDVVKMTEAIMDYRQPAAGIHRDAESC
jgi:dihydropteroate synthase